jgi:hypothetical protein
LSKTGVYANNSVTGEMAILRQLQSQHLIGEEQAVKQLVNCVMICGLEQTSTRL